VTRLVDHGAIVAAYVGIGMALTIGVSFLLVIPIEPIYWLLAVPAGLLIGYYANQRSDRRHGPWWRIVANALAAGVATGLTMAVLLLAVKGLFFFGDNGFPDFNREDPKTHEPIPPYCDNGAPCVYARYVLAGHGAELAAAGITDPATFTSFYWGQQASSAGTVLVLTLLGGLAGGVLYGTFRPKTGLARSSPVSSAQPGSGT
jgi:hypothetical protein